MYFSKLDDTKVPTINPIKQDYRNVAKKGVRGGRLSRAKRCFLRVWPDGLRWKALWAFRRDMIASSWRSPQNEMLVAGWPNSVCREMHYVCIALSRRESETRHSLIRASATLGISSCGNLVHGRKEYTRTLWIPSRAPATLSALFHFFSLLKSATSEEKAGKLIANATRQRRVSAWERSIVARLTGS